MLGNKGKMFKLFSDQTNLATGIKHLFESVKHCIFRFIKIYSHINKHKAFYKTLSSDKDFIEKEGGNVIMGMNPTKKV